MTATDEAIVQTGEVPAKQFASDGDQGDWQDWHVMFPIPFPANSEVRVIVTGSDTNLGVGVANPAVVGQTKEVTPQGFVLSARNSDSEDGWSAFNWIAVVETPGQKHNLQHDGHVPFLRFGVVQPQYFRSEGDSGGDHGDWRQWEVIYSEHALNGRPVVVLTANNLAYGQSVPAVGLVHGPSGAGFSLPARNSDSAEGYCNFFYLATLLERERDGIPVILDSGAVDADGYVFAESGDSGDWHDWFVTFHQAFRHPPVVLISPNDRGVDLDASRQTAVVPIARYVTPNGFTLSARNSDSEGGMSGFHWIALGCNRGCG